MVNIRILHVTTITEWRGGDAQMYALYGLLEAEPGFRQWILCPAGSVLEGKCRADGARCETYRKSRLKLANAVRAIVRIVRREGIAIVHAHDSSALNACLLAMRFLPRDTKLVLGRKRNNPIGNNALSRRKYGSPRISRIVSVSDSVARVFDGVVPPDKLATVYDAVDVDAIAATPADGRLRREHGLAPATQLVGNLAGHTAQKDLGTFLHAAARMLRDRGDNGPDLRFFLVGDGPLRAELEALAATLGIAGKVVFTGFRSDGVTLLAELDLLMMSSVTEGLPLTVYEAFAARVPVVSTDAGGIAEVVRDGETGFVVPVGDADALAIAALRVLDDPALAGRLRRRAFEVVDAGHRPEIFRDGYATLYRALAQGNEPLPGTSR